MDDPLGLPLPKDPIQRIQRFAYVLAWGAINEKWDASLSYFRGELTDSGPRQYIQEVWGNQPPALGLMMALGYMIIAREGNPILVQLTEKTFGLLNAPPPVSIFISYRRSVSSALAMLIAAELRVEGFRPFLDIRSIALGDEWHAILESRVRQSNIFIPVIGPTTLESDYVKEEVEWALENETARRIIPIVHAGFSPADLDKSPFPALAKKNPIHIREDNAADLFSAVQQLKAFLGA